MQCGCPLSRVHPFSPQTFFLSGRMPPFLFIFCIFYDIHTSIQSQSHNTFIRRHFLIACTLSGTHLPVVNRNRACLTASLRAINWATPHHTCKLYNFVDVFFPIVCNVDLQGVSSNSTCRVDFQGVSFSTFSNVFKWWNAGLYGIRQYGTRMNKNADAASIPVPV